MDDERTERIDLPGAGAPQPADPPGMPADQPVPPDQPAPPPGQLAPPPGPADQPAPPPPHAGPPVALPPPPPAPQAWIGAQTGWAGPARASLDVGSIVGRTFDTLGREWSLFLALAIPAGLGGFASGALTQSFQSIIRDPYATANTNPVPLLFAQLIIALLSGVTTLATVVATDRLWRGEAIGLSDAVGAGLSLVPRGIGFLLLVLAIAVAFGLAMVVALLVIVALGPLGVLIGLVAFVALFAAAIFVSARLSLMLPVLALERTPVLDVIGRTWRLTKGHALMLFVTAFVIGLCGLLPAWGSTLFSLFVEDRLVAAIALGLATLVTAPLSGIWCVLAWGELTGKQYHDSEVMAAGRGRMIGIGLVVGVGMVLLVVGGALGATGSEEFLRLYQGS